MRQAAHTLTMQTRGPGLTEITAQIRRFVAAEAMQTGLLTIWCRHTSASLLVQENASPEVRTDLLDYFARLVPRGQGIYRHDDEGPDDMPAHLRAALTQTFLSIPLLQGELALGTWQGIFLFEHRDAPHQRHLALHLLGE